MFPSNAHYPCLCALHLYDFIQIEILDLLCDSDNSEIDPRDLDKIRNDPVYVARFIYHNRGNLDNAYNHMVGVVK